MTLSMWQMRRRRLTRSDALRRWLRLATIACGPPTYWPPLRHHGFAGDCCSISPLPACCRALCYRHTSCTNVTPKQPGDGDPTPASTYTWVSNFERFLMSMERVNLYADRLICEYIILYVNFHYPWPNFHLK